jgi:hypothetical protein
MCLVSVLLNLLVLATNTFLGVVHCCSFLVLHNVVLFWWFHLAIGCFFSLFFTIMVRAHKKLFNVHE